MVMPVDESKKAKGGGEHVPHIHKAPTALCYNKQKTTATTIPSPVSVQVLAPSRVGIEVVGSWM
jgi:hypothetical protein